MATTRRSASVSVSGGGYAVPVRAGIFLLFFSLFHAAKFGVYLPMEEQERQRIKIQILQENKNSPVMSTAVHDKKTLAFLINSCSFTATAAWLINRRIRSRGGTQV